MIRSSVASSASTSTSTAETASARSGSSSAPRPVASATTRSSAARSRAAAIAPPRSNSSRYLAIVQPWPSSPIRLATGTRTASKKTWLTSWSPLALRIGRTPMPGVRMSTSRKLMPSWRRAPSVPVRTSANIMSA